MRKPMASVAAASAVQAIPAGSQAFESDAPLRRAAAKMADNSSVMISAGLRTAVRGMWTGRKASRTASARGMGDLSVGYMQRAAKRAQPFGDSFERGPEAEALDFPGMAPQVKDAAAVCGHGPRQALGVGFTAVSASPVPNAGPVAIANRVPPECGCGMRKKLQRYRHAHGIELQPVLKIDSGAANAVSGERGPLRHHGVELAARIAERRHFPAQQIFEHAAAVAEFVIHLVKRKAREHRMRNRMRSD